MDALTKIPFAIRQLDKKIVSVDDVPNGLACNCICPECHARLVARNAGTKGNIHHFAHYEKSDTKCEYAVYTSIRLMLLDVLDRHPKNQSPTIHIPAKEITSTVHSSDGKKTFSRTVTITKPCPPVYCSLADNDRKSFLLLQFSENITPDKDTPCLVIYFPPAVVTAETYLWVEKYIQEWPKRGILTVQYDSLLHSLLLKVPDQPIIDKLLNAFFNNEASFNWLHHPHEQSATNALLSNMMEHKQTWENEQQEKARNEQKNADKKETWREEKIGIKIQAQRRKIEMGENFGLEKRYSPARRYLGEVVDLIEKNGFYPSSVEQLFPVFEIDVYEGWIVIEKSRIWVIVPALPEMPSRCNVQYAGGMQIGKWVHRTWELNVKLKLKQIPFK